MSNEVQQLIVIMDFQSGDLYVLPYNSNIYEEPEDFFAQEEMSDISISMCEYMIISAEEFNVKFAP